MMTIATLRKALEDRSATRAAKRAALEELDRPRRDLAEAEAAEAATAAALAEAEANEAAWRAELQDCRQSLAYWEPLVEHLAIARDVLETLADASMANISMCPLDPYRMTWVRREIIAMLEYIDRRRDERKRLEQQLRSLGVKP